MKRDLIFFVSGMFLASCIYFTAMYTDTFIVQTALGDVLCHYPVGWKH